LLLDKSNSGSGLEIRSPVQNNEFEGGEWSTGIHILGDTKINYANGCFKKNLKM